jgi:predicted transcriptional regulator
LAAPAIASTTIRVDAETHARLQALSKQSGKTVIEIVRDATEALDRLRFAHQVAAEPAELSADEDAWRSYLADADANLRE